MNARAILALAAVAMLAGGGAASACGSGRLLFSDSFDDLKTEWGGADDNMKVASGKMTIGEKDGNFYVVTAAPTFPEVDFCANVALVEGTDLAGSYGGIVFWAKDTNNFYTFQITLDGYATAYVYDDGKWKSLVDDKEAASIKQGTGATNELRVVTNGTKAVLYINGTAFQTIEGTPPARQHIGFTAEAPANNGSATFSFDDVAVNEPSGQ
ncbi:MAG TPA: hypothetical protein VFB16_11000 [Bauldia sp.]|nr:hypothetical protein [Bauldia sp.]